MHKSSPVIHVAGAALALATSALAPHVALACPMCFTGNGTNGWAYIVDSIALMVVPTSVIGTLVYHAYKRLRAIDDSYGPRAPIVAVKSGAEPTSLRVVPPAS